MIFFLLRIVMKIKSKFSFFFFFFNKRSHFSYSQSVENAFSLWIFFSFLLKTIRLFYVTFVHILDELIIIIFFFLNAQVLSVQEFTSLRHSKVHLKCHSLPVSSQENCYRLRVIIGEQGPPKGHHIHKRIYSKILCMCL